jgi:hypothetical protein
MERKSEGSSSCRSSSPESSAAAAGNVVSQDSGFRSQDSGFRIIAPKGLQDSAQGFNPGNPDNKWFALKGREVSRWISHLLLRKIECAIETRYNWTLLPRC